MGATFSQEYQHCKVDPFTKEQKERIFAAHDLDLELKLLFSSASVDYMKFYEDRLKENDEATKMNLENDDFMKLRSTISILIITASDFLGSTITENGRDEYQNMNACDLSTAFLIKHLSHYALGIPYEQILITSAKKDKFAFDDSDYSIHDIDEEIPDSEIERMRYIFDFEEFSFFQHVNLAQVGDKQLKFLINQSMKKEIWPFNRSIIMKRLKTSKDSKLFVFLLDHDYKGKLNELPYHYFIKILNDISCKHFYVFNDSCYSTSMITLIKASQKFTQLFPNLSEDFQSVFFKFLSSIQIHKRCQYQEFLDKLLKKKIIKKFIKKEIGVNNENFKKYKEKIKNILIQESNDIERQKSIIHLIHTLSTYPICTSCVPSQIVAFGSKATVFATSLENNITFTLPVRRIYAGLNKHFRPCGNIFSSIYIQAFLNCPNSFNKFCNSVQRLFPQYKEKFENIIIEQNKKIDGSNSSYKPVEPEIVRQFFEMNPLDKTHLLTSQDSLNEWPNFGPIIINDIFWNVDISNVDDQEYNNVYLAKIIKDCLNSSKSTTEYGPCKEKSYLDKYLEDFKNAFNAKLKKNKVKPKFSWSQAEIDISQKKSIEEKSERGFEAWANFLGGIDSNFCCNLVRGIEELKYSIFLFFDRNVKIDIDNSSNWLVESYIEILPFWKKHRL